jgi:hypothetical protein
VVIPPKTNQYRKEVMFRILGERSLTKVLTPWKTYQFKKVEITAKATINMIGPIFISNK